MLGSIRKLLHKEREIQYDETLGYLTQEDLQKLREAAEKSVSLHRKQSYKTWICVSCERAYFYAVLRCPQCESGMIEERTNPVKGEPVLVHDMRITGDAHE